MVVGGSDDGEVGTSDSNFPTCCASTKKLEKKTLKKSRRTSNESDLPLILLLLSLYIINMITINIIIITLSL